ncbi:MAG: heme-binding protein [Pseudonocardia sp.]|nr:heme-binding protein [Pseudonocardia sp.]
MHGITLDQAQLVIDAARRKAAAEGLLMNIAVVDAGNNLTAFARMDGAWLGSIDIALDKASTARAFDMPTEKLGELAQPGAPAFGIHTVSGSGANIVVFAGGIPIEVDGQIVGAVGVSGGLPEQDAMVAQAGVSAVLQPA